MPLIEESVEIAAPPSDVFRFCHDPAQRPEWDVRVVRMELLTSSPVRSGTLIRVDAAQGGRYAFSWDGEVASYRFPSGSEVRVLDAAPSSPFSGGTETWDFSRSGSGTRVKISWDYKTRGIIKRILDALGRRVAVRSQIKRSLANLKALLESR